MTDQEIDDGPPPPAAPNEPARPPRRPLRRRSYEATLRPGETGPQPAPPAAMTVPVVPDVASDPAGVAGTKSAGRAATSAMEADS